jgi:[CysO sulfur-carrier protein]-S-L-cysteine hydrolase
MLTIRIPSDVRQRIEDACSAAGRRETGGMLFGEHVAEDDFRVVDVSVSGQGSIATFWRSLVEGLGQLEAFFKRTKRDYRRFNYLGEWHSHPSFALWPSRTDDETMFEIVNDPATGARFAVSMIVKLVDNELAIRAFAYFPGGERCGAEVVVEAFSD